MQKKNTRAVSILTIDVLTFLPPVGKKVRRKIPKTSLNPGNADLFGLWIKICINVFFVCLSASKQAGSVQFLTAMTNNVTQTGQNNPKK